MTLVIKKDESTGSLRRITVIIVDQSDGNTLETGQTNFNIEVSKAGGTQAAGTGVWGEVGEGEYYYEFGTTEVNTFGKLTARFAKTGMREFKGEAQVVGFNPYQTISTQSSVNTVPTQTEINVSVWGALPANVAVQTDINNLNDPTPSEINAVITTAHGSGNYGNNPTASAINAVITVAHGAGSYSGTSSTVINSIVNANLDNLNDPTPSEINAVIETAHGAGSYAGTSSTVINSIVNAQGLEIQSLINALNDPTSSEINAVITTDHGAGAYTTATGFTTQTDIDVLQSQINQIQSTVNAIETDIGNLNDPTSSEINAVITTAHGAGSYTTGGGGSQTDISTSVWAWATRVLTANTNLNDPTASAINAVITTAHGVGSYTTGGGGSQTDISTSVWGYATRVVTANTNLNDPTPSAINAVITTAHGAGSYVGAGASQTIVNKLDAIQTDVNAIQTDTNTALPNLINGLNDPTSSEINAVITTAHGAGSYVGSGGSTVLNTIQTVQNIVNVNQSKINNLDADIIALNDPTPSAINAVIETAHGAGSYAGTSSTVINSIVNAQGLEIQSLINALNDPTSSEINAVITTAHGAGSYVGSGGNTVVNLLNAIQTDVNNIATDINNLNDVSTTEVQSIVNAEGLETQSLINALNDVSTTEIQSIVNAQGLEVQSLINALNDVSTAEIQSIVNAHQDDIQSLINNLDADVQALNNISTSEVQSIVNAQGLETQSLINALNDISTAQVQSIVNGLNDVSTAQIQSIVNAEGTQTQSLINAMQSDVTEIKGLSGYYLVAAYTYNTSFINNKIQFRWYDSQTNMNTDDQSTGNLGKRELNVTLSGQLADKVKTGDHS